MIVYDRRETAFKYTEKDASIMLRKYVSIGRAGTAKPTLIGRASIRLKADFNIFQS